MEWQPIETAPKTGRKILLFYRNKLKNGRTVFARWCTSEEFEDDDDIEDGWYECVDNWDEFTEIKITEGEPTHWAELPKPPHDIKEIN